MLDFLNSLGKKIVSQPERVSTDTYSDAITGKVKDTVSDYVENFPIADPELYSKLPVGMVGSALSIPAETANLASYIPFSPYKPLRESGALEPYRKDATLNFLFNLGSKLNPESTTFQRTGSPTEEYALGVLPDVLIGFGAPTITKIPSLAKKADDFIQTKTATDLEGIAEALALAGQTRQSPLSLVSMAGEASLGKTTFPRELDENYFFNKAYEISRNLDQEKGTPDQFRSMFEKGGVTKDEFRWSGLGEFLKEQKQANLPVTKEGVTDFLDENRMSVSINKINSDLPSALVIDQKPVMEGSHYTETLGRIIEDMFEVDELRGADGLTRILLNNYGSFNDTELKIVGEALDRGYINEDLEKVYPPDTVMMNDMMNEASEKFLENIPLTERQIENWWKSKAENRGEFTSKDDDLLQDLGLLTPKARAKAVTDYRMQHQPRGGAGNPESIRLDDLTKDISGNTAGYPNDIYHDLSKARKLYGGGVRPDSWDEWGQASNESVGLTHLYRNRPDAKVTMYRAVPNDIDQINEGDFVTLSPKYAKLHASSGYGERGQDAGKVISEDVYVRDIYWAGDDINEYGYFPTPEEAPKNWKEALHKGKEEYAQKEYDTEDYQQIEVSAKLPDSDEILYSVTGDRNYGFYDEELFKRDLFASPDYIPEDPNEFTDVFYQLAREDDFIAGDDQGEFYENLTPPYIFGTREAYNVNLYEDISDLARKNTRKHVKAELALGKDAQDVTEYLDQMRFPSSLQSHFGEYANEFPIGHVRSTIRDLNGQGTEFEDDYLQIFSKDSPARSIPAEELNEAHPNAINRFAPRAIKTSNLDGEVYAIHEIQSDVAQKLTSPKSSAMTPSGLEKAKNEARKAIGKNPESKMVEFDERAEAIRKKGNEFVKNLNEWQQFTPSKLTQEEFLKENKVREFKKDAGHLETETNPQYADHLFKVLVKRQEPSDFRNISDYLDFKNKNEYQTSLDTPYSLLREKEELASELRRLELDMKAFEDANYRLQELEEASPTVMDAPYIQEKRDTTRIMLKGEIAKAVDANADYVTLGEPIFNRERQGFTDAKEFYGVAVPKIAEKILKPLDPDIKIVNLDVGTNEVVKGFKITEKLKKALREQGQSYFAPFTAIGTGILSSQVAKEQENSYE